MDIATIIAAADANLAAKATYVQSRALGMVAHLEVALTWGDCGLPCDTFNMVCRARLEAGLADARVREVVAHFARSKRPFAWWHSPWDQPADLGRRLEDAGLVLDETDLAMAADLVRLRVETALPAGLRIGRARTPAALQHFAAVVAANWSPPDSWVLRFYELAAPVVLTEESPLWYFVGYLEGVPVASAEVVFGGGVAGLYSVCTLEAYRRRGFGTALTAHALLAARAAGCSHAILQASTEGAGIYARAGFEAFGEITEYKPTY
jgi:ribosomal protein S18 acetylase RimI-like enzyme